MSSPKKGSPGWHKKRRVLARDAAERRLRDKQRNFKIEMQSRGVWFPGSDAPLPQKEVPDNE